jgi:hypothetical protein
MAGARCYGRSVQGAEVLLLLLLLQDAAQHHLTLPGPACGQGARDTYTAADG